MLFRGGALYDRRVLGMSGLATKSRSPEYFAQRYNGLTDLDEKPTHRNLVQQRTQEGHAGRPLNRAALKANRPETQHKNFLRGPVTASMAWSAC